MKQMKRLTRGSDKVFYGVCSGLAEYLDIDTTITRLIALFLMFAWPPSIIIYLIVGLIMPTKNNNYI